MNNEDTIVARATPQGVGAIAIVRLSGQQTGRIVDACFRPKRGATSWAALEPRRLCLGAWRDPATSRELDEAQIVIGRQKLTRWPSARARKTAPLAGRAVAP